MLQFDPAFIDSLESDPEPLGLEVELDRSAAAGRIDRRSRSYIRWVQAALNRLIGAGLRVDGLAGPRTRQTVRIFQRRHGLRPDGVVGPRTERALRAAGASPPPIVSGAISPSPVSIPGPVSSPSSSQGGAPRGPFGTLTLNIPGHNPFRYSFTVEDVLWTARFIVGEAGGRDSAENRAVIWAMFNRYAFFTHRVYPTFSAFIRRYSTTLQPVLNSSGAARRHMNSPQFVRTGGTYPGTGIPKGQLKRHLQLQRTPWAQLPSSARALAVNALRGRVANPGIGNASEFADTAVYFRDRHRRAPSQDEWREFTRAYARSKKWTWVGDVPGLRQYRVNSFFIDSRVSRFPPNAVRIQAQR